MRRNVNGEKDFPPLIPLYFWPAGWLFVTGFGHGYPGKLLDMNQPLRILHLEDNPADSLLVRDHAQAGRHRGGDHAWPPGAMNLPISWRQSKWDLILADYRLPDFTGLDALKLVREKFPALPFILMSGTIGELAAIESLKAGATDYVLKQNRERLPSAVRRAVAEADRACPARAGGD